MKKIVFLTGAGISAESGIKTFRDSDGLWENHPVEEVATIGAWHKNPALVQEFYNQRRKQLLDVEPNIAHKIIAMLQDFYVVEIVTQNVDNLHERAGSNSILHLHGELTKSRSTSNPALVYTIDGWEIKMGDQCELGSQLRPHIVWFGEDVPLIEDAAKLVESADILIIIGTSMNVYPAAGLLHFAQKNTKIYFIDPKANEISVPQSVERICEKASDGMKLLFNLLVKVN